MTSSLRSFRRSTKTEAEELFDEIEKLYLKQNPDDDIDIEIRSFTGIINKEICRAILNTFTELVRLDLACRFYTDAKYLYYSDDEYQKDAYAFLSELKPIIKDSLTNYQEYAEDLNALYDNTLPEYYLGKHDDTRKYYANLVNVYADAIAEMSEKYANERGKKIYELMNSLVSLIEVFGIKESRDKAIAKASEAFMNLRKKYDAEQYSVLRRGRYSNTLNYFDYIHVLKRMVEDFVDTLKFDQKEVKEEVKSPKKSLLSPRKDIIVTSSPKKSLLSPRRDEKLTIRSPLSSFIKAAFEKANIKRTYDTLPLEVVIIVISLMLKDQKNPATPIAMFGYNTPMYEVIHYIAYKKGYTYKGVENYDTAKAVDLITKTLAKYAKYIY